MSQFTHHPISLDDAIKVTEEWREYFAKIIGDPNCDSPNVFRGFTIPLSDIQNLVKMAEDNPDVTGVRAYIAKGEVSPGGEVIGDKIHIVLLPITGDCEMSQEAKIGIPVTKDLYYNKTGASAIYNFTTPCPELCDFESDLYKKRK
jgi:hypothetical protein